MELYNERRTIFYMFKHEFPLFKKLLFIVIFCMTVTAYGYWAYLLYKIYTDNRPLFDNTGARIPLPDGQVWRDYFHYDTHLLAAFQGSVLGSLLCIVIVIAL